MVLRRKRREESREALNLQKKADPSSHGSALIVMAGGDLLSAVPMNRGLARHFNTESAHLAACRGNTGGCERG